MDEAVYKAWLPLHERAAREEVLTPEEQARYEAGCAEMDAGGTFTATLSELRAARWRWLISARRRREARTATRIWCIAAFAAT